MLLAKAIETFITFKQAKGLSNQSITWYRHVLALLDTYMGQPQLEEITPLAIALWLAHERNRTTRYNKLQSSVTIEGYYRGLSTFFNWCEASSVTSNLKSPLGHGRTKQVERPKTNQPDMDYVSYAEYHALTAAIDLATWLDYRDWSLIGLMFWCGVRSGELLAIQSDQLRLPKKEIRILHTKTRKPRPAFLTNDLAAGITTYLEMRPTWQGSEMWLAYNKARNGIAGALSKTGLRLMLQRRCHRAGIRFLNPHLFRHGFAMEFLNHEAEIKAVSSLLGHATVKTTERHYAQWLDGPLRRVHQRIADRISSVP